MGLTQDQQQSVNDSGGYYDVTGKWIDLSGSKGAGSGDTAGGSTLSWLLPLLGSLGATIGGRAFTNASAANAVPPELSQLLQMSAQRAAYQNPMFQATTQGMYQMLPNFARQGTALSGSLSNQVPAPMPSAGGGNPLTSLNPLKNPLLSGLLGAAGSDLAKGNIPFQSVVEGLKKLGQAIAGRGGTGPVPGYTGEPFGNNLPSYDPFGIGGLNNPTIFGGLPSDPSGGTGVGPGMQAYYDSLRGGGGPAQSGGGGESYEDSYGEDE